MGRFDAHDPAAGAGGVSLGDATTKLGSTLEREIAGILEAAQARAAAIEQEAMQRALESARVAGRRDKENRDRESQRLAQLLERLNNVEESISGVLDQLRDEIQAARADLAADPPPALPEEPAPEPVPEPPVDVAPEPPPAAEVTPEPAPEPVAAAPPPEPAPEPPPPPEPEPEPEPAAEVTQAEPPPPPPPPPIEASQVPDVEPIVSAAHPPEPPAPEPPAPQAADPELERMLRERITAMLKEGKSRTEAAQFLTRFNVGKSHLGLIDEIYWQVKGDTQAPTGQRPRRFRRNR